MNSQPSIEEVIQELAAHYQEAFSLSSPKEINQGLCVEFADDLADNLKRLGLGTDETIEAVSEDELKVDDESFRWNAQVIETMYHSSLPKEVTWDMLNRFGDTGYHAWVQCNGIFYDAECARGVRNLFDLPFYKRFLKRKTKV